MKSAKVYMQDKLKIHLFFFPLQIHIIFPCEKRCVIHGSGRTLTHCKAGTKKRARIDIYCTTKVSKYTVIYLDLAKLLVSPTNTSCSYASINIIN